MEIHPLIILAVGIATVIGMILVLRLNAFIALITSAILVSLLAPGEVAEKISRVADAFGESAGKIGIVIALAAIIGTCMMDSGAADRVVRAFLRVLGEKRAPVALMGSGFVLAVPVFFDTVFYLLVPLGRSLYRRTGKHYLLYVLAIACGGAITHTLVPPTPGPLLMAANLDFDIGLMILVGAAVALPSAVAGLAFCKLADRLMTVPMRPVGGADPEGHTADVDEMPPPDGEGPGPAPLGDEDLPPLWASVLPVVLPVVLISINTALSTLAGNAGEGGPSPALQTAADLAALFGNANLALLLAAAVAMLLFVVWQKPTRPKFVHMVETSLMSGGIIILITAGGGAFGAMLTAAGVGDAIQELFSDPDSGGNGGLTMLLLGFGVAAVLKIAQGSSTVAMITASGMLAGMVSSTDALGFHPVYLATAIGSGSLIGSWMNDSGFWIFAKMSGLTETEALKSWTPLLLVLGTVGLVVTAALAAVLPLTSLG